MHLAAETSWRHPFPHVRFANRSARRVKSNILSNDPTAISWCFPATFRPAAILTKHASGQSVFGRFIDLRGIFRENRCGAVPFRTSCRCKVEQPCRSGRNPGNSTATVAFIPRGPFPSIRRGMGTLNDARGRRGHRAGRSAQWTRQRSGADLPEIRRPSRGIRGRAFARRATHRALRSNNVGRPKTWPSSRCDFIQLESRPRKSERISRYFALPARFSISCGSATMSYSSSDGRAW